MRTVVIGCDQLTLDDVRTRHGRLTSHMKLSRQGQSRWEKQSRGKLLATRLLCVKGGRTYGASAKPSLSPLKSYGKSRSHPSHGNVDVVVGHVDVVVGSRCSPDFWRSQGELGKSQARLPRLGPPPLNIWGKRALCVAGDWVSGRGAALVWPESQRPCH
jgi:hypothetical protein